MSGLFENIAKQSLARKAANASESRFQLTRVAAIVSDYEPMFREAAATEFNDLWLTISPSVKARLAENSIPAREIATVRNTLASVVKKAATDSDGKVICNQCGGKSFNSDGTCKNCGHDNPGDTEEEYEKRKKQALVRHQPAGSQDSDLRAYLEKYGLTQWYMHETPGYTGFGRQYMDGYYENLLRAALLDIAYDELGMDAEFSAQKNVELLDAAITHVLSQPYGTYYLGYDGEGPGIYDGAKPPVQAAKEKTRKCNWCNGDGVVDRNVNNPCKVCGGTGVIVVKDEKKAQVASKVIIEGGHRDQTVMHVVSSLHARGPLKPGYALRLEPFAFSDFPYYFGSKNQNPKWFGSIEAAVKSVQAYLDKYDNGGVVKTAQFGYGAASTVLNLTVTSSGESDITNAQRLLEDGGFVVTNVQGDTITCEWDGGYDETIEALNRVTSSLGSIEMSGEIISTSRQAKVSIRHKTAMGAAEMEAELLNRLRSQFSMWQVYRGGYPNDAQKALNEAGKVMNDLKLLKDLSDEQATELWQSEIAKYSKTAQAVARCEKNGWDVAEVRRSRTAKTASFFGTIEDIRDEGTIVQFIITRQDGTVDAVAGDGNMTRAALDDSGIGIGDTIEYDFSDWGGLEWFAPAGGIVEAQVSDDIKSGDLVELIRESLGVEAGDRGYFVGDANLIQYGTPGNVIIDLDSGAGEVEVEADAIKKV